VSTQETILRETMDNKMIEQFLKDVSVAWDHRPAQDVGVGVSAAIRTSDLTDFCYNDGQ